MSTTIVGIFDNFEQAQQAVQELEAIGVSASDVAITRGQQGTDYSVYGGEGAQGYSEPREVKGGISGFFERLFGSDVDEQDRGVFAEAARRGSTVVTVKAQDTEVDRVVTILDRYDAVDVDQRAAHYSSTGYASYDAAAPVYTPDQARTELESYSTAQAVSLGSTGTPAGATSLTGTTALGSTAGTSSTDVDTFGTDREVALPVIEEQLKIGKREVRRGGVRVYSRVTETPVEEQVRLREEHVTVERRTVDRPVTDAEVSSLVDSEIVMTETAEEAVAAKEARVVEEVVVGKQTTEHTETVRDTVRRTDVEVEKVDADDVTTRTTTKKTR
jgi:uncharacterized protein (TIGR02271 family)